MFLPAQRRTFEVIVVETPRDAAGQGSQGVPTALGDQGRVTAGTRVTAS